MSLFHASLLFNDKTCSYIVSLEHRFNQSSSCGVRSAAICYNVGHKFEFDPSLLTEGENEMVLSLPYNATNYEPALLTESTYVQYDALRLEVV